MIKVSCYDSNGQILENLTQWDINQKVVITGVTGQNDVFIHFSSKGMDRALVVLPVVSGSTLTAQIPNVLLQNGKPLNVYVYSAKSDNSAMTIHTSTINVVARAKPDDYEYNEMHDASSIGGYSLSVMTQVQFDLAEGNNSLPKNTWIAIVG